MVSPSKRIDSMDNTSCLSSGDLLSCEHSKKAVGTKRSCLPITVGEDALEPPLPPVAPSIPRTFKRALSARPPAMAAFTAAFALPPGDSAAARGGNPFHRKENGSSRLGVSRPSWIVRTESNVRKERRKKPDPPCVVCKGSGRIDCYYCQGRGRTNCVHQVMLPRGEWPKWCKVCGGSGLEYCNRCLGTGEYRDIFGFHFMKINGNSS